MYSNENTCLNQLIQNYRSPESSLLSNMIARNESISVDSLLFENGADGAIRLVFQLVKLENAVLYLPKNSYEEYQNIAEILDVSVVMYDMDEVSEIVREINQNNYILICNPSNPTGECHNLDSLVEESECKIIVDECYIEYSTQNTVIKKVSSKLIVIRTFSKVFCSPGIRIGYILSSEKIINKLKRFRLPYPVSNVSLDIAKKIYREREFFLKKAEYLKEKQVGYSKKFENAGYQVSRSVTNFFSVYYKSTAEKLNIIELAFKNKLVVKDNMYKGLVRLNVE